MSSRPRQAAIVLGAFLVGVLPGFFVAFNVVFSDGSGLGERLWSLLYVLVAYGAFGGLFGALARVPVGLLGAALWAPAFVLLALYTTREPGQAALHLIVLLLAAIGSWGGAWFGRRMRRPHTASGERPSP